VLAWEAWILLGSNGWRFFRSRCPHGIEPPFRPGGWACFVGKYGSVLGCPDRKSRGVSPMEIVHPALGTDAEPGSRRRFKVAYESGFEKNLISSVVSSHCPVDQQNEIRFECSRRILLNLKSSLISLSADVPGNHPAMEVRPFEGSAVGADGQRCRRKFANGFGSDHSVRSLFGLAKNIQLLRSSHLHNPDHSGR
jgi:hypothetical protein